MTLKAIKAMFTLGSSWKVTNIDPNSLTIVGNTTTATIPPLTKIEVRRVYKVATEALVMQRPAGTLVYAHWPKASQVSEARDGFLKFKYENNIELTLERIAPE